MRTFIRPWASLLVLLAFTTSSVAIAPRSFADDSDKQGDKVSKVDDAKKSDVSKSDRSDEDDRPWWKRWLSGAGRGAKKTGEGTLKGAVWIGKQAGKGAIWVGKQAGKGLVWVGKKSWKQIKKFFRWIGKDRDAENRTTDEKIPQLTQSQIKVLPAPTVSNPPAPPKSGDNDNQDSDSSDDSDDTRESMSAA